MEPITKHDILAECARIQREVSEEQADKLARYLGLLIKWNRTVNLVGPHGWREIFRDLVADSLFLEEFVRGLDPPQHGTDRPLSLDLGSGAGLPGIPLRILWTPGNYWLTEKRGKRVTFLRTVLAELKLPRTRVFHGPAEEALDRLDGAGAGNTADLAVARAFMPWKKLLDFARPLLRPDTGRCLILANEPPPDQSILPAPWELVEVASYPVGYRTRYFWAFAPRAQ